MATVILLSAFLTNPKDYEYLLKDANREALAQAIAKGAKTYQGAALERRRAEAVAQEVQ